MRGCQWGECDEPATETVTYPGKSHAGATYRCTSYTEELPVCEWCAPIAREEAANLVADHDANRCPSYSHCEDVLEKMGGL